MQFLLYELAFAQGTVIYQDDFEGSVSGWSDSRTDFDPDTTTFLGPFDVNMTSTQRTFAVPAGSDSLEIEFDLLRFDSWDDFAQFGFDRFQIDVDGTQILSLPFPNPQAARSGSTGNVDWSHTPSTGTVELAYVAGQYWFDQIHRFVVTVNNPGASVTLNLRAAVSQAFNDESAGYDNFLVTAHPPPGTEITAVAESFAPIDSAAGGVTTSVLASDTYDNQPATLSDVTLSVLSSSSSNVVLNPLTGLITVNAGTAVGQYTVEYEICETPMPTNCSSVEESITVRMSSASGTFCPIGTAALPGTYHAVAATGQNNPNLAVGQPFPENTTQTNTAVTFFGPMTLDLTGNPNILAAEGDIIEVALSSHWGTAGLADIRMSADGVNYTSLGTTGNGGSEYPAWTSNVIRYDDFTVPAGGARYLQVFRQASGVRVGGVTYGSQCQPSATPPAIVATDDAETLTSLNTAQPNFLNVIDNDTFDGAAPVSFDLALSSSSTLPPELTFDTVTGEVGVVAGAPAGVYSFDYDICEAGTTNCETATVTITIEAGPILAVAETFPAISGGDGGATTSVLASDTLNSVAVAAADVTVTNGASDPELTLDPNTGLITVSPATLAGTYSVTYTICENLNPVNCDTVDETVEVVAPIADISITKTNTLGVNGNVDQATDTLISGQVTTYSLFVTNNGPDSVVGAIITDMPGAGLSCAASDSVTLSGAGVPPGSFTLSDLTGAGITLGFLADGDSTTLTYSCSVN